MAAEATEAVAAFVADAVAAAIVAVADSADVAVAVERHEDVAHRAEPWRTTGTRRRKDRRRGAASHAG